MSDSNDRNDVAKAEREAIRRELEAAGRGELVEVAVALEKQAVEEEVPPMPESLEAKVRERYGKRREVAAVEEAGGGLLEVLRGLFGKPVLAGGMLAALGCAVLAMVMLSGPGGSNAVRGGGGGDDGSGAVVIVVGGGAIEGVADGAQRVVASEAEGGIVLGEEVGRMRILVKRGEMVVAGFGEGEVEARFEIGYGDGRSVLEVIAEVEERLRAGE